MGVSGSGKTTVGTLLAGKLGVPYAEADDFHPARNVAKMASGVPLDDDDRRPWLDAIAAWLEDRDEHGGVVSCSALRRRYRDRLRKAAPDLFFIHLTGSPELIAERMTRRKGHFMPPELLLSQISALEPLEPDEAGAVIPVDGSPEEIAGLAAATVPR
ncbi:MAG TPA: gluconokinase [Streptomyces sp.]|nr:gluconokinase [Streptomyces sp.]